MTRRPFLVLPSRECVPLEGAYRIEQVRGDWYVLGHYDAIACASESEARMRLAQLSIEHDAHELAAEALEGLPAEYEVVASRA